MSMGYQIERLILTLMGDGKELVHGIMVKAQSDDFLADKIVEDLGTETWMFWMDTMRKHEPQGELF